MTKDWCSSSPSCWEQTVEIWPQRYMVSSQNGVPTSAPHLYCLAEKQTTTISSFQCCLPLQSMPCMRQLLEKLGDRPWTAGPGWLEAAGNEAQWAGSSRDISAAWGTNTTYCWFKSRASSENRVTHLHLREDEKNPPRVKIQRAQVYPPLKQLQERHLTQPNPRI